MNVEKHMTLKNGVIAAAVLFAVFMISKLIKAGKTVVEAINPMNWFSSSVSKTTPAQAAAQAAVGLAQPGVAFASSGFLSGLLAGLGGAKKASPKASASTTVASKNTSAEQADMEKAFLANTAARVARAKLLKDTFQRNKGTRLVWTKSVVIHQMETDAFGKVMYPGPIKTMQPQKPQERGRFFIMNVTKNGMLQCVDSIDHKWWEVNPFDVTIQ